MEDYLKGREMRTLVKDEKSRVEISVKWSIIGISDALLLRKIKNDNDCEELQNDINKIYEWSKTWEIKI